MKVYKALLLKIAELKRSQNNKIWEADMGDTQ
jgi:hypothetical protein